MSLLATLVLSLCVVGCSPFTHQSTDVREPAPADLDTWEARGKVAVTIDERSETARFVWQRRNLQTDIVTLSGPFAMNQTTLERRGNKLWRQLDESRQRIDLDASTDPLAMALKTLPPESIGNWLLGHGTDGDEWQIDVAEWQASSPWQAPKRMTIRGANMEIKVIISQWTFGPVP